jgi:hypothetical protein
MQVWFGHSVECDTVRFKLVTVQRVTCFQETLEQEQKQTTAPNPGPRVLFYSFSGSAILSYRNNSFAPELNSALGLGC